MVIERIERALEIARLQRQRVAEAATVLPSLAPADAFAAAGAHDDSAPVATPRAEGPNLFDARAVQLPPREALRERYVVFPDEPGPASQAYKMLRTQVLQRARQHAIRVIGVVSAVSGEGKTVTAVNLALSLAVELNQSVVLVDLDLRRPSIAKVLGLDAGKGVESFLRGDSKLEDVWCRIEAPGALNVVPAAAAISGSSELLSAPRTADLIRLLRSAPGEPLVLVDLPPVLLTDDALAIAPLLDGVVLVVTEERTSRDDVQRVFELLRATPVIGSVFNASADAESRSY